MRQLRQPGVLAFFVVAGLMQLSHGPYYTFITLYLESLGYPRGVIGQLWAVGVVAEILVFLLMVRLLRHFSLRQVLLASLLLAVLRWILLGTLADQWLCLLLAQLLHAATFGSFHSVCVLVVRSSFNARQQGQGQALYAAVSGVGGGLGALFAGYSWTGLGPNMTFLCASLVALLGAIIIYRQMPVPQS